MYVSVKGRLGVYIQDSPSDLIKQPAHIVDVYKVVGDKSLEHANMPRNATVTCLDEDETICLVINRKDYKKIINVNNYLF